MYDINSPEYYTVRTGFYILYFRVQYVRNPCEDETKDLSWHSSRFWMQQPDPGVGPHCCMMSIMGEAVFLSLLTFNIVHPIYV